MTTFLADKGQMSDGDVTRIASDCLQQRVDFVSKIGRGGNSKVYHVICPSQEYVVKFYFLHPSDLRDRLGTEFKSLSFLWGQGFRMIPKPVSMSKPDQCAFYEYIKGTPPAHSISPNDIDAVGDFIENLKKLNTKAEGLNFLSASEAFFSALDIVNSIRARLKRFCFDENTAALQAYLQNDFLPLLEDVVMWSKGYLSENGVSWEHELAEQYRTLSPSDFGLHNALRTSSGGIVFLDFEYFGWDDPVKLVSDFLWHPAMSLTEPMKQGFTNRIQGIFNNDRSFQCRLKAFFPLFGLKWCLILLNEYVPVDMQRRGFAQELSQDKTVIRLNQLTKARALSHLIRSNYTEFPYGN